MSDDRPRPSFTANELLELLGATPYSDDPDAMTRREIAEMVGHSMNYVSTLLRKRIKDGSWVSVGAILRTRGNGAPIYPEGFKPVKP